jgi:hypothetical protein
MAQKQQTPDIEVAAATSADALFEEAARRWVSQFDPEILARRVATELHAVGLHTVEALAAESVARSSEVFSALRAALLADAQALEACAAQVVREQRKGSHHG